MVKTKVISGQRLAKLWQIGLIGSFLMPSSVSAMPKSNHVEAVVAHLVGVMDTSTQAAADGKADVRMTTCKVSLNDLQTKRKRDRPNSVYLYQEQALSNSLASPYRQRFLQISTGNEEKTVISQSYKPIEPKQWSGFCDRPEPTRIVSTEDISQPICSVLLKPKDDVYVGQTPPDGCPTKVRGAVKITTLIILHAWGMDTWDRGFDEEGNQVWGAKNKSYQFRWID